MICANCMSQASKIALIPNQPTYFISQAKSSHFPSNLPLHQPPKEIKTITITLQLPHPPRPPILPPQLLHPQHPPIPCNPQNPSPDPPFGFQCHDLLGMQPVFIVFLFELPREARAAEGFVDAFEGGEDSGEELFEREGREAGGCSG
jgi:hypothetical protein